MRVYVPATLERLRGYVDRGGVPADVERFVAPDQDEESEYAALDAAAEASAGLLDGCGRRVVVVAEVEDPDADVSLRDVAAVHADTDDVDPADPDPPELGWYATQEIGALLAGTR